MVVQALLLIRATFRFYGIAKIRPHRIKTSNLIGMRFDAIASVY